MNHAFADAVIVAAGASRRMDGVDKLAADVAGRPLLAWSVDAMAAARSVRRIVVVGAADKVDRLAAADWIKSNRATVVAGGETRGESVLAGIRVCEADIVLVHDGARPLVTPALADAVADASARSGAAIPVVPVADSLKATAGGTLTGALERDGLVAAQTPQGARRELLVDAFAAAGDRAFTDEAGLLQAYGVPVATIPGEVGNLKVTLAADLELVRLIAQGRHGGALARTGFGQDSHQFGREDGLWLGGVLIAEAPRLHGHSDGDVALHALATAILSAAGLGDLGRLFPADDAATTGAASALLLREAAARSATAGWRLSSAQVALAGSRPRLGSARLDAMRAVIAATLATAVDSVSLTASSGNLSGPEGKGLAISATAVVTMVRA